MKGARQYICQNQAAAASKTKVGHGREQEPHQEEGKSLSIDTMTVKRHHLHEALGLVHTGDVGQQVLQHA
jgi:hypothetical protein